MLGFDQVEVFLDSQLVERQLKGQYKVKSPELKPLYDELNSEIEGLKSFEVSHVRRELNKRADKLVNEALDKNEDVFYEYDLDKLNNNEVKVNKDVDLSLFENDGKYVLENLKKLFESAGISNFELKVLKAAVVVIIKRTELSKLENIVDDVNIWVNNSDFKKIFFEIV
ncbi:MAG: reverse transcriptase-like protein [Proteocatella sp.]